MPNSEINNLLFVRIDHVVNKREHCGSFLRNELNNTSTSIHKQLPRQDNKHPLYRDYQHTLLWSRTNQQPVGEIRERR